METISNIKDLRNSLIENYAGMKAGAMEIKTGKELANMAGKILSSCKVELEYNMLMGEKKHIAFLD